MKKIAFIILDLSQTGGVQRVTTQLANEMCNYYDVHVISVLKSSDKLFFDLNENIHYCALMNREVRMKDYLILSVYKLRKYCKVNNISHCFFEGEGSAIIGAILCKISKVNCVFCDHGAMNYVIEDNTKLKRKNRLIKFCSRFCDRTVVLTNRTESQFIEQLGIDKDKLIKIYNFYDSRFLNTEYNRNSKKIITVSRITDGKGLNKLIEVAKNIKNSSAGWIWDIYGSGNLENKLRELICEENLEDFLFLKGESDNLEEIYTQYGIFVFTSMHEGLPMVLLEAKAAGLPIISFDIETGPKEIVIDNVNGCLITPFDVNEMVKSIENLQKSKQLRISYSLHSKDNLDLFSKESVITEWRRLIDEN